MIAAELTVVWGMPSVPPYEAVKLSEIQRILEKPFFLRWISGIFSWLGSLSGKIPFRVHIETKKEPS